MPWRQTTRSTPPRLPLTARRLPPSAPPPPPRLGRRCSPSRSRARPSPPPPGSCTRKLHGPRNYQIIRPLGGRGLPLSEPTLARRPTSPHLAESLNLLAKTLGKTPGAPSRRMLPDASRDVI